MPNSFSLTELFMCKSPILRALGSDYLKVDDIYQSSASFNYSKTRFPGYKVFFYFL